MKKLFLITILSLLSATAFVRAELAINLETGCWYSRNPSRNIDQNEYNSLVIAISNNPHILDAAIFSFLRAVGTPTALQLIDDLEKYLKEFKKDARRTSYL